ncbi:MAG: alpha/beta hydrolase [Nanoarchaeota archaeon]|nr:alpha/beta hydrolase [Nanoarchaeota archaeon]
MEQKHVLTDDGIRLSYAASKGLNHEPCFVFLHGAGSNHTIWHAIIKNLSQYRMILPDSRGHGNSASGKLRTMTIQRHAKDIKAIIDNEKLSKVILIGNCLGASIAREFTIMFPECVDKIVLISLFSKRFLWLSSISNAINNMAYLLMKPVSMRKSLHFQDYADPRKKQTLFSLIADIKGTHLHVYSKAIKELFRYSLRLEDIAVPALLVQGKQDLLAKNSLIYEIISDKENINLRMVNAHHLICRNAPQECTDCIRDFI